MLTPKQEAFCLAYMETGNASEAYRRIYSTGKMKPETVNRTAFDLLQNHKIATRVAELRAAAAERAVVTESRVLEEAARIGLLDPAKLFDAAGNLLPIHQMPPEARAAIAGLEVEETSVDGAAITRVRKVKLVDKNSALEKLMKHLGMFEKDHKQRAGLFDNVPAEKVKLIQEHLRALTGTGVAGQPAAGSPGRTTH